MLAEVIRTCVCLLDERWKPPDSACTVTICKEFDRCIMLLGAGSAQHQPEGKPIKSGIVKKPPVIVPISWPGFQR